MPDPTFRPRRSCLYMPGANARALEKARDLPADAILMDLEDAVAPDAKAAARDAVSAALKTGGFGKRERVIRINGLETDWGADDLAMAAGSGADAILVPKVTSAADIHAIEAALKKSGAPATMRFWVMIEMPLAILNLQAIAAAAQTTRLSAFVMGTNDLAKELRTRLTPGRFAFQAALQQSVLAARAYGLAAIDGVYNDIPNAEGFEEECAQGSLIGFEGKTLIHPSQLDIANRVFAPAPEDVAQAHAVIAAFAAPENAGKGVLKVNGKMTELLHLSEAQRIVALADAIAGQS